MSIRQCNLWITICNYLCCVSVLGTYSTAK